MFLMAALHTFDNQVRKHKQDRSQSLPWFGASLAVYITDRLWQAFDEHQHIRVLTAEATEDKSTVVLILRCPASFSFRPGQFAQLCIPAIDGYYHRRQILTVIARARALVLARQHVGV